MTAKLRLDNRALFWLWKIAAARHREAEKGLARWQPKPGFTEQAQEEWRQKKQKQIDFAASVVADLEAELVRRNMEPKIAEHRLRITDGAQESEAYRMKSGQVLTDDEIKALADEAERGYDVSLIIDRPREP